MGKRESQSSTGKYKAKVGDKVICDHHGVLYEAKVLTVKQNPDNPAEESFFVHYQGWSKNWDEWVSEDRILKFNESNEALMVQSKSAVKDKQEDKEVKDKIDIKEKKTPVSSKTNSSSTARTESLFEDLELKRLKPEVKIKIIDELKEWLIDDENNIKNKKLSILPVKVTINTVLKDFVNYKKATSKLSVDKEISLNECMLGLKYAFNVMVGAHLLYKFERPQYQNILKEHGEDVDLTTFYGPVHLVRMLTKLGVMMAFTTLENKDLNIIVNHITDIMKFFKKQSNLFDVDKGYQIAPPEYIRQYQRAVD